MAYGTVNVGGAVVSGGNEVASIKIGDKTYSPDSDGVIAIPNATSNSAGAMSKEDKAKLDELTSGDNGYTHPGYSAKPSGLYKITVDDLGHVSAAKAVVKSDITDLGIPAQDTNYTHPTTAGNKHIPSGGSSGQILRWGSNGTAVWGADVGIDEDAGTWTCTTTAGNIGANKTSSCSYYKFGKYVTVYGNLPQDQGEGASAWKGLPFAALNNQLVWVGSANSSGFVAQISGSAFKLAASLSGSSWGAGTQSSAQKFCFTYATAD